MAKSGLIMALVALIVVTIGGVIFGCCGPLAAIVVAVIAGYLAGVFDKPVAAGDAAKKGAGAGGIASIGALLAQVAAALINSVVVGPEAAAEMMKSLGVTGLEGMDAGSDVSYYIGAVGGGCCFGVVDIVLMAAFGALGGFLWYQITSKKAGTGSSAPIV